MSNVVCIKSFRKRKRKQFLDNNGDRLERFIDSFFRKNLCLDFHSLTVQYLHQYNRNQTSDSWDYLDYRDALREALSSTIGEQIQFELERTTWYDQAVFSYEAVIDRCLSQFILQDWSARSS